MVNLSTGADAILAVRNAPFAEADETGGLALGAPLFLCARSIDQHWQAVVIPSGEDATSDCGVVAPVPVPRAYAGPCRSGWVLASSVEVTDR